MEETTTMHETNPSPSSVALRYGLITGFLLIIYSLILYVTGLNENKLVASLGYLILIGGIIVAYKHFKRENGGFMSYGQGLGIGTLIGVIVGLLAGVFGYIYTKFIDPTVIQRELDKQIEQMENKGLSEEQIEQAMEMGEMFSGPVAIILMSLLIYALSAFIFSLIIAAIMKNNRPEFE